MVVSLMKSSGNRGYVCFQVLEKHAAATGDSTVVGGCGCRIAPSKGVQVCYKSDYSLCDVSGGRALVS